MSIPGSANALLLASTAAAAGGYQIERSLRFNSNDSAYLSRNFSVSGNQKIWTWGAWIKRAKLGSEFRFFDARSGGLQQYIRFDSSDALRVLDSNGTLITSQVFRDLSAWYHVLVALDTTQATASNRIKLYVNGSQITTFSTESYPTQNSDLLFNSNVTHQISWSAGTTEYFDGYLADIHFIDGQALTPSSFTEVSTTTGQLLPKAYSGSYGTNGFYLQFADNSSNTATTLGKDTSGNSNNWTPNNFVVSLGTQYSGASRFTFNAGTTGWYNSAPHDLFDGSLSTALSATNGNQPGAGYTWDATGLGLSGTLRVYTYGDGGNGTTVTVNGTTSLFTSSIQWLDFGNVGAINTIKCSRLDQGVLFAIEVNGSQLVENVSSDIDSLVDTPTSYGTDDYLGGSVRGNYATLNQLDKAVNVTLSNGNLQISHSGGDNLRAARATIKLIAGKWYCEAVRTTGSDCHSGIITAASSLLGFASTSVFYGEDGKLYVDGSVATNYGITIAIGDVVGIAVDMDAAKIYFYKNGTLINTGGTSFTTTGNDWFFKIGTYFSSSVNTVNFGQRAFAYPVSGYKALVDTNLGAPLVAKPNTLFDVALWSGNGGSQTITLPGAFSPNFVWIKRRSSTFSSLLYDTVRGNGPNTGLISDSTTAEGGASDNATYGYLNAFNSTGFALTAGSSSDYVNTSGQTYVGWAWDAGEGSAVSNGSGSITSQVRANASAGFSVATYTVGSNTSQTIGHGLGVAPQLIIVKERNQSNNWFVYHNSIGNGNYLSLNTTTATTSNNLWNNTSPTSTVFTIRSGGSSPTYDGRDHVAYCFAPVVGYSSALAWTGNGSADGPLLHCGFSPRFWIFKRTDTTGDWWMIDTARSNTGNPVDEWLAANRSDAEYPNDGDFDFLSNGIKIRTTSTSVNASGGSYIGFAWASNPFQYARAQ